MMMALMVLIPLVLIVWAMLTLGVRTSPAPAMLGRTPEIVADRPLDAVRARYLRGEIDRDEYEWRVLDVLTR